ncbi:hypothetical protein F5B22DRAFT_647982 [Xylaria bambusicola]|uniref:uncharacterized protein n=1 Tax=Xylaria bambusicola TaxID=326684 RepID=UPI0020089F65|nr:uncharacterized protein F5B22DRAFT_647982 [Xylaria bambusicola]KAI0513169.1 hypothetical protein F5B22DRAFT_647982 [Xylaria bambusicola]
MAYSNEISVALPPSMRGVVGGVPRIDMTKQQLRKPQRHHPKSQPFDPEDLRRRLYVVIAEREAQSEKRQRQRVDAMPAKWAQVERERDTQQLYIEHLAATTATTWMPEVTAPPRRPSTTVPKSRLQQPSAQDKLRQRNSMIAAPSELSDNPTDTTECPKYRHIPEQAAAQFSRTTTSGGMQGEKSTVHSLSRAALRLYVEGTSSADRSAIDSSITPGFQRKILQRAQSQRDRQYGRNQFQESRMDEAMPWRRSSKSGASDKGKIEEESKGNISALADLHLHAFPNQGDALADNSNNNNNGSHSSEETLVDAATANEHRVDWTQSDEMLPSEKKGVKFLRKTTSILTLKGKLGHLRRNSNGENNAKEGVDNGESGNKLRIVTIQEACDEQAEADADDGSTPMSPHSGTSSSRSGRPGIWARLKRG